MANLHMEGLDDLELLEVAEQALASLSTRFTDEQTVAETFSTELAGMLTPGEQAIESIEKACDHFDRFAELLREAKGVE